MKQYNGFLIDLDGTMYRGTEVIQEAGYFVNELKARDLPYLFVTNNSSRTPLQVAQKLKDFGIAAEEKQVFTSSLATANYLYEQKQKASIYVIGEEGLQQAIADKGFHPGDEDADFVVVGIDRAITYEKFALACLAVRNGATLISTNADIAIPTERGFMPGNGALLLLLAFLLV